MNNDFHVKDPALRIGDRRNGSDPAAKRGSRDGFDSDCHSIPEPEGLDHRVRNAEARLDRADIAQHEADRACDGERAHFYTTLENDSRRRRDEGAVAPGALREIDVDARGRHPRIRRVERRLRRIEFRFGQAVCLEQGASTLEVEPGLDHRRLCLRKTSAALIGSIALVAVSKTRDECDRVVARIPFNRLPTRYPYVLMVPQYVTESILLQRLRGLGGDVVRPCSVTHLRQADGAVCVTLTQNADAPQTIQARYVVGADGMHSTVRAHTDIEFVGAAYEQSFILADVRMKWGLPADEVMAFFSPHGLVIVAPLPGALHRIVATVDEAPEQPTVADVQALMNARGPERVPAHIMDLAWSLRFRVHHRLAERYRAGRVLLAGDAAHVHSPAGGQGMNTGIHDAIALAKALTAVLSAEGSDADLDAYQQRRRPAAERVVALTDRMTLMATVKGGRGRALRNLALGVVGRLPVVPRMLATELAGLHNH
jgi:2-polyprenyl-6-methoxyphenol hydroxylase-like FAD-dependent oxidoreductase